MAIIIRDYHLVGVTDLELKQYVGPAVIVGSTSGTGISIQTPDDPDSLLTLDEYMATKGFKPGKAYTAAVTADWVAPAPSNLTEAVDRIAAQVVAIGLIPIS